MENMRAMRARTPPGLWLTGLDAESEGLPDIDAAKPLNQGLSTSSHVANLRQEKLAGQLERQRRKSMQKPRRKSVLLEMEIARNFASPSASSTAVLSPCG